MQKEGLHYGLSKSARSTLIILIIGYRKVILGHKILSGVVHAIYKCALQLCVKIRHVALQQRTACATAEDITADEE
jgi:hypothetical protein